MTISVEGAAQNSGHNVSSSAATLTTTNTNDVACAFVMATNPTGSPSFTSVTSGSLTWAKRWTYTDAGNSSHNFTVELWTAPAASTVSESVTANAGGTYDHVGIIVFAVAGLGSGRISAPFDSGSLPQKFHQAAGANVDTSNAANCPAVSTAQVHDIILGFWASNASPTDRPDTPDGWTDPGVAVNDTSGTDWCRMVFEYKVVSATQSSLAVKFRDFANAYDIVGDAMSSDTPPRPKRQVFTNFR